MASTVAKSRNSKIAGFKELLENLPNFRQPEVEVPSSEEEEQIKNQKMKLHPPQSIYRANESDAPKGDSDDEPLVCLAV